VSDEMEDPTVKHFEQFYTTSYRNCRFKFPPFKQDEEIGWRVEFRPIDLQNTDFENTAFSTFLILLARTIIKFKLDFLLDLKELDENMKNSEKVNACLNEKFNFRFNDCIPSNLSSIKKFVLAFFINIF